MFLINLSRADAISITEIENGQCFIDLILGGSSRTFKAELGEIKKAALIENRNFVAVTHLEKEDHTRYHQIKVSQSKKEDF